MKKLIFLFVLFPVIVFGQSQQENYIKTSAYKVNTIDNPNPISQDDKLINITYYDGLGRPIQKVAHMQSGRKNDIITHIEYDRLGRQNKEYLPYARISPQEKIDDVFAAGTMEPQALREFYNLGTLTLTGNPHFETTDFYYSQKLFEDSPLNRIIKQAAPGESWHLGSDHEVKMDFQTNIPNEVRKFKVQFPNISTTDTHTLMLDGFYAEKELYKNITKDENWKTTDVLNKTTQEFTNKEGQMVLKRTFDNGIAHDTYYVYDFFGNLSYVIPPTASDAIDIQFPTIAVSSSRSLPWTDLALVDAKLAEKYNRLFSEYQNQLIRDQELMIEFGGQGGFTIAKGYEGQLILDIDIQTVSPMFLRTGIITSLSVLGTFPDAEIGRIQNHGGGVNEYIFLIRNNALVVDGGGAISNVDITFNGMERLAYNNNYPWSSLVSTLTAAEVQHYKEVYRGMNNNVILTTQVENPYGAYGGINIAISESDVITINLNITATQNLKLKDGLVIKLASERRLADRDFGTVTGTDYSYKIGIKENSLYISGSGGGFQNISFSNAVNLTTPSFTVQPDIIEGLCYVYRYDVRNRMVEKKIPCKGWDYIVYDKFDRPVFTSDAESRRNSNWLFTKYDKHNRVVYTGQFKYGSPFTDSAWRKDLQSVMNNITTTFNEIKSEGSFASGEINVYYTSRVFPTDNTDFTVFTVNYYDNYDFALHNGTTPSIPGSTIYGQDIISNVKALPTCSMVRVLGTDNWIANLTGFDKKGRPVWSYSKNTFLKTDDEAHMNLDFIGNVLETTTTHIKGDAGTNITTIDKFTYDRANRLLKQTQSVNGQTEELIALNVYDELGTLVQKKVGGPAPDVSLPLNMATTGLQTVDYRHNVRGWLTNINRPEDPLTGSGDLFAFNINYETLKAGVTELFNGNITQTTWRSSNDDRVRKYNYSYDDLNRLKQADYIGSYQIYNSSGIYNSGTYERYSEGKIEYDKNGNIMQLYRYGLKSNGTSTDLIDKLIYHYGDKSNTLLKVTDNGGVTGFTDVNVANTNDYSYDLNGNMIGDINKSITGISYNHLNLPTKIGFNYTTNQNILESGMIEYVYDATGIKLSKRVTKSATATTYPTLTTQYAGNHIYEEIDNSGTPVLHFFSQPEGYAANDNGIFSYVYQYKDHLGNVRLSYIKKPNTGLEIIEESNYYPFGMKHQGYNNVVESLGNATAQKYRYNSKEYQDELGLNVYDYGARFYMPDIGRWPCIDPQAELLERSSPYVYALNSPLVYVDNDGELPILINGKTMNDSERADVSYWTTSIVNTIKNSGIANPGGEVHYVDGNRGHSWSGKVGGYATKDDNVNSPSRRAQGGRYAAEGDWKTILSKLARDPKTGKIIEKIQIYTHSRGAAFGVGYTEKLLELIKENSSQFADPDNVIDFVYNMAPHQSDFLTAPDGVDSYSMDHNRDKLSDNDMEGVKGAFSSDEKSKGFFGAHSITSFQNDLKAFTSAFLQGGTSQDVINNFVKTMKEKYGVTVTVK